MPPAKKRVAVTGGSGQLGTLVLKRLCADRSIGEVISLDVRPPATICAKLRALTVDVRASDLEQHLHGCDAVVHLAFVVGGYRPRAELEAINVEGSRNVIRAAARAGVKQIVYSSSMAAYGVTDGHPRPIVEETPRKLVADFPYSADKYRVEAWLDEFEPAHPDLAIARLRPGILIGAHMENVLGDLLRMGLVPDGGGTPAPLVWDEDVADAVVTCVKKGARGAFNLAADEQRPARELVAQTGLRVLKVPPPVLKGFARVSPFLERMGVGHSTHPAWCDAIDATMVMSSDKARRELGWTPRCATAASVVQRYADTVPRRLDRRIAVFLRLIALASGRGEVPEEARRLDLHVHLALTGKDGGDRTIHFDHGRLRITRGGPRPPSAVITLSATTFLDLLAGRTEMQTATMLGKLRVEGEALAGMYLQGMFTMYRSRIVSAGPVARRLDAWLSAPSTRKEAA
jgi:nucleoside-diphosphate-sugar epimerase/putative sterol carrier protein